MSIIDCFSHTQMQLILYAYIWSLSSLEIVSFRVFLCTHGCTMRTCLSCSIALMDQLYAIAYKLTINDARYSYQLCIQHLVVLLLRLTHEAYWHKDPFSTLQSNSLMIYPNIWKRSIIHTHKKLESLFSLSFCIFDDICWWKTSETV